MLYTENSKLPGIESSEVYLTSVVSTYPESDNITGWRGGPGGWKEAEQVKGPGRHTWDLSLESINAHGCPLISTSTMVCQPTQNKSVSSENA